MALSNGLPQIQRGNNPSILGTSLQESIDEYINPPLVLAHWCTYLTPLRLRFWLER